MSVFQPSVELDGVTVEFGDAVALQAVDLELESGSLVGLLGRNGAGKTTLMRTIMGLGSPTRGEIRINGVSTRSPGIHDVRRSVGYLSEEPALYDELTGREFVRFMGELHRVSRADQRRGETLLARLDMAEHLDRPIRGYSMGTRKKVAFVAAVVHAPQILILDEPTGGLDAASARLVKETMIQYRDEGRLVLFSTHVMKVAERWADRLAILDRGRLAFEGDLSELRALYGDGWGPKISLEDLLLYVTRGG